MKDSIRVFAPATVANVVCGFDILGFAVDKPGDEIILRKNNSNKVNITQITGDSGRLSLDPLENTATLPILQFLQKIGSNQGLDVELHKKMPFGSGLGSSAASAVAGVHAVNALFGSPLSKSDLLPFAMEGERLACGTAHADNVAPSLYGGFVLIRSYDPLDIIELPTPEALHCAIVHPDIEVPTRDARDVLRKNVLLKDAITQWGNVAGMIASLYTEDFKLLGRSMKDVLIEPTRSLLIPGFQQVKSAALQAGAIGSGISGSGPSLFSLADTQERANQIASAKSAAFEKIGVSCSKFVSKINHSGPLILD